MSKPFLKPVLQVMPARWHRGGKPKPLSPNERHPVPTETRGQQHCREWSLHSKMALPERSPAEETEMHLNSEARQGVCAAPSALICWLRGMCHHHPVWGMSHPCVIIESQSAYMPLLPMFVRNLLFWVGFWEGGAGKEQTAFLLGKGWCRYARCIAGHADPLCLS